MNCDMWSAQVEPLLTNDPEIIATYTGIYFSHSDLFRVSWLSGNWSWPPKTENDLYSSLNGPDTEVLLNPEMIPKSTPE